MSPSPMAPLVCETGDINCLKIESVRVTDDLAAAFSSMSVSRACPARVLKKSTAKGRVWTAIFGNVTVPSQPTADTSDPKVLVASGVLTKQSSKQSRSSELNLLGKRGAPAEGDQSSTVSPKNGERRCRARLPKAAITASSETATRGRKTAPAPAKMEGMQGRHQKSPNKQGSKADTLAPFVTLLKSMAPAENEGLAQSAHKDNTAPRNVTVEKDSATVHSDVPQRSGLLGKRNADFAVSCYAANPALAKTKTVDEILEDLEAWNDRDVLLNRTVRPSVNRSLLAKKNVTHIRDEPFVSFEGTVASAEIETARARGIKKDHQLAEKMVRRKKCAKKRGSKTGVLAPFVALLKSMEI